MSDRIEDWIEERASIEDLAGEGADDELLRMLAAAQQSSMPHMSERAADEAWERVRSRDLSERARAAANRTWLSWAAALASLAVGLSSWSALRVSRQADAAGRVEGRASIKHVRFESTHEGKRVTFEMQVYKTQRKPKEVLHVPTP